MQNLLTSDSALIRWTMRLGELVLLNICFLLCCLPVITAGAAVSGLYSVCFRFGTSQERGAVVSFFRAFRQNLKQGIALSLVTSALHLAACWLTVLFLRASGPAHYGFLPSLVLLLVSCILSGYAFPLLALFDNTLGRTLKNALILGISYLPRSLVVVAVNLLPLIVLLVDTVLFLRLSIFCVFLYFSAAAYINTLVLKPVFAPFLPEEEAEHTGDHSHNFR